MNTFHIKKYPDIWFTSDTHYQHKNSLTFLREDGITPMRDFSTVEEMNETLIENHNKVVKPNDKIYNCGDVFFGSKDTIQSIWKRLNGHKRLIVGNHDDIKYIVQQQMFQKINMWRMMKEFGLLVSHVPLHETSIPEGLINVHGHTHHRGSPTERHKSVCVEMCNYTPIHLEELINI